MEIITIDYGSWGRLLEDLRESGQTNARADRGRGLAGRRFGERLRSALDASPRITTRWSTATPGRALRAKMPRIKRSKQYVFSSAFLESARASVVIYAALLNTPSLELAFRGESRDFSLLLKRNCSIAPGALA